MTLPHYQAGTTVVHPHFRLSERFPETPCVNVIQLFIFVADDEAKQARVFAPDKNFPV